MPCDPLFPSSELFWSLHRSYFDVKLMSSSVSLAKLMSMPSLLLESPYVWSSMLLRSVASTPTKPTLQISSPPIFQFWPMWSIHLIATTPRSCCSWVPLALTLSLLHPNLPPCLLNLGHPAVHLPPVHFHYFPSCMNPCMHLPTSHSTDHTPYTIYPPHPSPCRYILNLTESSTPSLVSVRRTTMRKEVDFWVMFYTSMQVVCGSEMVMGS